MADEAAKPNEAQVNAANAAEEARWQPDFTEEELNVPYKRDEKAADDKRKPDVAAPETPAKEAAAAEPEEAALEAEPTPLVTTTDPGEYVAQDYSFEVTNKDGKAVKISSPDEANAFADDDDNFKTARDLKDFLSKAQKMETKLERDYEKWQEKKQSFDEQVRLDTERRDSVNNTANEIEYLVSKGKLPATAPEYANADWSDPDVAKQPGVKEQIVLINYMVKENKLRAKAGIRPIGPVDALTAMQAEQSHVTEDRQAAAHQRQAAGARVAGVSAASSTPYVPKGIAVGNPNVFRRNQATWDN